MNLPASRLAAGLTLASTALAAWLWLAPSAAADDATASSGTTDGIRDQITTINSDVKNKQKTLKDLQQKEQHYRQLISEKRETSASLQDQISLAENGIARTQLGIEIARTEIKGLELEIGVIDGKIKQRELQMANERRLLGTLARRLYGIQFRKSAFEVLLADRSLSTFFDRLQAVTDLQGGVRKTLSEVKDARASLDAEKKLRETKQAAVEEQERGFEVAKRELEDDRALKNALLIDTKASELEYRYRLAELKQEQNQADSEITYLENTLREKIGIADQLRGMDSVLSWPVEPTRGISAMFHDPSYPFRYVFEHPGVDIRAAQGTPVRAAAAGVVARAKDGGMGYSYVMIIHNNDVATVYGHLSRITAREDTFVERGEIVGFSGGLPGTPGAGPLTTGPHLHFETRLKGIPMDPMRFLASP